jgi:hypothetical protein
MLEHKQPGKSTLTGHHSHDNAHGHPHGHGATPGKKTLVEQHEREHGHGGGALASAASFDGGGAPTIGTSTSASLTTHDGPVRVEQTVTLSLSTGKGPVAINIAKGSLSVGDDHMSFDTKTPGAAKDGHPGLVGTGVTVTKGATSSSNVSVKSNVLTGSWSTTYTLKTKHWTASLTCAVTASSRLKPPPERHGFSKLYHSVTHFLAKAGHIAAKALHDFVDADVAFVHSTNKWGAAFMESLAAAAAAGEVIVVAV